MRRATIYRRRKQFLMHASSRTTDGVWILTAPCLAVPEGSDDSEVQRAIRAALDGSQTDVPHPQVWKGLLDPLLRLAGVKAWSTFSKGTSCIEVEEEGTRIVLIPTRNLGPEEGFQVDPTKQITLNSTSAELGASVRHLLTHVA